ncbi:hypothetical protein [Bosea rubneri]|uniref:Uncharacterized protein n=1 Tax=Bosea rubneri TaxID=3075434 RepID=A0ABU3SEE3_9HYPH|nr:hypothetical protein [Bosea sp. ZW T0_25]MDU0343158.1 hypothetical protein [Bosea sp. ZW T0_25]
MEHHVDRRVVLSTESEYPSLYEWSISEVTPEGKSGETNQIPWEWTLWFEATELTLHDTLETEFGLFDRDKPDSFRPAHLRRSITAKLHPSRGRRASWEEARYSFFGTGRFISDFELRVAQLSAGEDVERCEVWGTASYTSEGANFLPERTGDYLSFNLFIKPENFARFATQISLSAVTSAAFSVGGVPGFYSAWSPTVLTSRIKILASLQDQRVELPAGSEIDPPRLGRAREFHFVLSCAHKLKAEAAEDEARSDEFADRPASQPVAAGAPDSSAIPKSQFAGTLNQLRIAAWLIVVLLLVNLVR